MAVGYVGTPLIEVSHKEEDKVIVGICITGQEVQEKMIYITLDIQFLQMPRVDAQETVEI